MIHDELCGGRNAPKSSDVDCIKVENPVWQHLNQKEIYM